MYGTGHVNKAWEQENTGHVVGRAWNVVLLWEKLVKGSSGVKSKIYCIPQSIIQHSPLKVNCGPGMMLIAGAAT